MPHLFSSTESWPWQCPPPEGRLVWCDLHSNLHLRQIPRHHPQSLLSQSRNRRIFRQALESRFLRWGSHPRFSQFWRLRKWPLYPWWDSTRSERASGSLPFVFSFPGKPYRIRLWGIRYIPTVITKLVMTAVAKPFSETQFLNGSLRKIVPLTKRRVTSQEIKAIWPLLSVTSLPKGNPSHRTP